MIHKSEEQQGDRSWGGGEESGGSSGVERMGS